jgi:type IV pilus assembly protein PilN
MIRINLLQEKKKGKRRRRASAAEVSGQKQLLIGLGIVGVAGALGFFLVHMPLQGEIDELRAQNAKRQKTIAQLTEETKEFDAVQAQLNAAKAQEEGITRLQNARAAPSWMLYELSSILTKDHKPTMSLPMAERIKSDPNRQFMPGWDPKRIWITMIEEKGGVMRLEGGAQSTTDVTQLTLRLQASVYFDDVEAVQVASAIDAPSKQAYYKFSISGKVLY